MPWSNAPCTTEKVGHEKDRSKERTASQYRPRTYRYLVRHARIAADIADDLARTLRFGQRGGGSRAGQEYCSTHTTASCGAQLLAFDPLAMARLLTVFTMAEPPSTAKPLALSRFTPMLYEGPLIVREPADGRRTEDAVSAAAACIESAAPSKLADVSLTPYCAITVPTLELPLEASKCDPRALHGKGSRDKVQAVCQSPRQRTLTSKCSWRGSH